MSQQDNFFGGFVLGTVLGGVVGGVVGVLVASRLSAQEDENGEVPFGRFEKRASKRDLKASTEQSIEVARRGLEDKIAQLNDAIDDVRHQLGGVNSANGEDIKRPIARDL